MNTIKALILSTIVLLTLGYSPAFSQNFTKAPYLLVPGETEMTLRWELDSNTTCVVNYGMDKNKLSEKKSGHTRGVKENLTLYEAHLDGLTPGQKYYYQVNAGMAKSKSAYFTTFKKDEKNIHFVAMGDSRSHPAVFTSIINSLRADEPDLIISMGDLVASGGEMAEWTEYYYDIAKDIIDHIPLVSTLGDHEGDDDNGELFRHFLMAEQPTDKLWFSFDYGNAHFVSLDYRHPDNDEMMEWFVNDMTASDARWTIVYYHRPSYNFGGHRSSWGRDRWPALFSEHKVDIVFAGHSHLYERFHPMQRQEAGSWPVTYITTGGAGAGLYEITQHSSLAVAESVHHFVDVVISQDTLRLKAIREDNSLLDEFTIIKQTDGHAPSYRALVQSQERVNLFTNMMSAITPSLNYVPFQRYVSPQIITLESDLNVDIPFRIQLTKESEKSYKMETVHAILKAGEKLDVPLEIFSIVDYLTISGWGEIDPELRLKMIYDPGSGEETIIGGKCGYWPDVY